MVAAVAEKRRKASVGSPSPRIGPPTPARSEWKGFVADSKEIGVTLFPWQESVSRYLYALGKGEQWHYREVAAVVGRQNGKTELLVPHVVKRLRMGRRIMHTAQNREIPREVFNRVAATIEKQYPELFQKRRGRVILPRLSNGQEEIHLANGGHYRIVAPTSGGGRGPSVDDLIIDEVRELDDTDFTGAAEGTQAASPNPQTLYLTSAGSEESVVLNAIKERSREDPSLAYLEWSAPAEMDADDQKGWRMANPAIGFLPGKLEFLEATYRKHLLSGTMAIFETEYLCRWVVSLKRRYVEADAWAGQSRADVGQPLRAAMGVSMDPSGDRASAVTAWRNADDSVSIQVVADVTGDPISVDAFGPDLRALAAQRRVFEIAYDPWTDVDLARHLMRARTMNGRDYATASVTFARLVDERKLRMDDETSEIVGRDLARLTRRSAQGGAFMAVRSNEQEPATAALAAIRAVALVAIPTSGVARIY